MKYDSAGNFIWHKTFKGDDNITLESVKADSMGHLLAAFSNTIYNIYVGNKSANGGDYQSTVYAQLDTGGNCNWIRSLRTSFYPIRFKSLCITPNGDAYSVVNTGPWDIFADKDTIPNIQVCSKIFHISALGKVDKFTTMGDSAAVMFPMVYHPNGFIYGAWSAYNYNHFYNKLLTPSFNKYFYRGRNYYNLFAFKLDTATLQLQDSFSTRTKQLIFEHKICIDNQNHIYISGRVIDSIYAGGKWYYNRRLANNACVFKLDTNLHFQKYYATNTGNVTGGQVVPYSLSAMTNGKVWLTGMVQSGALFGQNLITTKNQTDFDGFLWDITTIDTLFTDIPAKTMEEISGGVVVYPNPASHTVNVQFTLANQGNLSIKLMDMYGRLVTELYQSNNAHIGNQFLQMQLPNNLPTGMYFIHVCATNKTEVKKLIIKQ